MHSGYRPRSVRAQSSVIGIVLIIGLTLAAASAVVVFGSATLDDGQQRSQIGQAEQALTQFDSRAAQVALGDSDVQTVRLGQSKGQYRIDPEAGHVTIEHINVTYEGSDPKNETIYSESLGAVIYDQGETEIAYQGGGVWRKDEGRSVLVSPPEFHYRQATLTFPVVRVNGNEDIGSGGKSVRVSRTRPPRQIFPNQSAVYNETYDLDDPNYSNPVQQGRMKVTVQSDYCRGWKIYFESRTEGDVSDCDDGNVSAELASTGTLGDFEVTSGANTQFRGVDAESLTDFELNFESDSSSGFNNFDWKMATSPNAKEQFEIYVEATNGDGDGTPVHVHIYYSNDGGETYHSWVSNGTNEEPFILSGTKEDARLKINLLGDNNFTYTDINNLGINSGNNNNHKNNNNNNNAGPTYDGSEGDFAEGGSIGREPFDESDTENVGVVSKHYFGKAATAELDLEIKERQPNKAESGLSDESWGYISYEGGGRIVTFLHVTENTIEVQLD